MILVDTALRARAAEGRPIRVGLIGAGFMARGVMNQIIKSVPGMRIAAVYNRHLEKATAAYTYVDESLAPRVAETQRELDEAVERGLPVVTENAFLIARSPHVDVLLETTGSVEFGANVVLEAFRHGK